jgi:hypothetical protein
VWEVLGIEPTDDEKRVKQAYAERLRTLDVDKDIAGFQKLRVAYESALAQIRRKKLSQVPISDTSPSAIAFMKSVQLVPEPVPDSEAVQHAPASPRTESEAEVFFRELNAILERKDTRAAFAHLDAALARGIIPISSRAMITESVMATAVADKSIPPEEFESLMKRVGWNTVQGRSEPWSQVRQTAMVRMDAYSWYRELREMARDGFWRPSPEMSRRSLSAFQRRAQRRNARMIVRGSLPVIHLSKAGIQDLVSKVEQCRHYREWIEGPIKPRAFRRAEAALAIEKRWGTVLRVVIPLIGVVILLPLAIGGGIAFPPLFFCVFFARQIVVYTFA